MMTTRGEIGEEAVLPSSTEWSDRNPGASSAGGLDSTSQRFWAEYCGSVCDAPPQGMGVPPSHSCISNLRRDNWNSVVVGVE